MAFVVKNDLQNFANKLNNYKAKNGLDEKIADKVANKGAEIAQKNWVSGVVINIKGNKTKKSDTYIHPEKLKLITPVEWRHDFI